MFFYLFKIKTNVENKNKREELNKIAETVCEYLKRIESAPGLAFHEVPFSFYPEMDEENEDDKEKMD